MKIGIACDHRGCLQKQKAINYLNQEGYTVIDCGTDSEQSVDYPDYAFKVSKKVQTKEFDYGILICSSGVGMSIAANKVKKIRCAKVNTVKEAFYARNDNDCNVIAMGNEIPQEELEQILNTFLTTPFAKEERFIRRIAKVDNYDD